MIGYAVDVTAAAARARIPERIAAALAAAPTVGPEGPHGDAADPAAAHVADERPTATPEPAPTASGRPPEPSA
jgi:hypothetical protein